MNSENHTGTQTKSPRSLLSRRRFFHHSGAAIFATGFLTSCSNLLDDILPKKDPEIKQPELNQALAFFGDSLTIGAGGTTPYGNLVGAAFPGRPIQNDGILGQVASSIAVRQGGIPLTISVEGGKLDGLNEVKITKLSNPFLSTPFNEDLYSRTGTINGVKCTITRTVEAKVGDRYTIKPEAESTIDIADDSVFALDNATQMRTATQILWFGRNNIGKADAEAEILQALDSAVAYIADPKRFIVLGILVAIPEITGTSNFDQVKTINDALAAKYGKAFVPMTPPTEEELAAIGYTPTEQDLADLANENFPTGLRPARRKQTRSTSTTKATRLWRTASLRS